MIKFWGKTDSRPRGKAYNYNFPAFLTDSKEMTKVCKPFVLLLE